MKRKYNKSESLPGLIITLPFDIIFYLTTHFLSLIDFGNFSLTCKKIFQLLRITNSNDINKFTIKTEILIEIAKFAYNCFFNSLYEQNSCFFDDYFNKNNIDLTKIFIIDEDAGSTFFSYFSSEKRKLHIITYINILKHDLTLITTTTLQNINHNLYLNMITNQLKYLRQKNISMDGDNGKEQKYVNLF